MIDLLDTEAEKILSVVQVVQQRYTGKEANGDNLLRLHNELVTRLEDLGFSATVDVTPIYAGLPVSVSIDDRLDSQPFDAEHKRWDVKHRDDHGKLDQIEGLT